MSLSCDSEYRADPANPKDYECAFDIMLTSRKKQQNAIEILKGMFNFLSKGLLSDQVDRVMNHYLENKYENIYKTQQYYLKTIENDLEKFKSSSLEELVKDSGLFRHMIEVASDSRFTEREARSFILGSMTHIIDSVEKIGEDYYSFKSEIIEQIKTSNPFSNDEVRLMKDNLFDELNESIDNLKDEFSEDFESLKKEAITKNEDIIKQSTGVINIIESLHELREELQEMEADPSVDPNEISAKQNDINILERQLNNINYRDQQLVLNEVGHAATILSTIISFCNEELGYQINVFAQNGITIAKAISTITSGMASGEALGPYAAIAVSVFNIYSMFKNSGPSPEQIILEQLQQVSKQINTLRNEMHERFDRIEEIIDTIYKDIMEQFTELRNDMQDGFTRMYNVLERVDRHINRIEEKLEIYIRDRYEIELQSMINECIYYQPVYEDDSHYLKKDKFASCCNYFELWAVTVSIKATFTGYTDNADNHRVSDEIELSTPSFEDNIGLFVGILQQKCGIYLGSEIPNPLLWAQNTFRYLQLIRNQPFVGKLTDDIIKTLIKTGNKIEQFIEMLKNNFTIVSTFIQEYNGIIIELYEGLKKVLKKYCEDNDLTIDTISTVESSDMNHREFVMALMTRKLMDESTPFPKILIVLDSIVKLINCYCYFSLNRSYLYDYGFRESLNSKNGLKSKDIFLKYISNISIDEFLEIKSHENEIIEEVKKTISKKLNEVKLGLTLEKYGLVDQMLFDIEGFNSYNFKHLPMRELTSKRLPVVFDTLNKQYDDRYYRDKATDVIRAIFDYKHLDLLVEVFIPSVRYEVKLFCIELISKRLSKKIPEILLKALQDNSEEVIEAAVKVVGNHGKESEICTSELNKILGRKEPKLRVASILALLKIGTPDAIRSLERTIDDEEPIVRALTSMSIICLNQETQKDLRKIAFKSIGRVDPLESNKFIDIPDDCFEEDTVYSKSKIQQLCNYNVLQFDQYFLVDKLFFDVDTICQLVFDFEAQRKLRSVVKSIDLKSQKDHDKNIIFRQYLETRYIVGYPINVFRNCSVLRYWSTEPMNGAMRSYVFMSEENINKIPGDIPTLFGSLGSLGTLGEIHIADYPSYDSFLVWFGISLLSPFVFVISESLVSGIQSGIKSFFKDMFNL